MLLSIILSFRNEEDVLPKLIEQLRHVINPLEIDYELIFINDASTDTSLDLLTGYQRDDERIKIINMSRRFGKSPCVTAGLKHARGDAVLYMDVDLQDPPDVIPAMLEKYRQGADVVHTVRTKRNGESLFKMWLTKRAYHAINLVSDIEIPQNAGDFKLFSRRALDELLRLEECDPFMRGLATWVGFNQVLVYYEREARLAGQTHFSLLRSLNPVREFVRGVTSFSEMPLYFALILGFFVSLGTLGYLVCIIVTKLMGMHEPGWPAQMVTTLFLGGTILFTIGVLGIYIGKIHQALKHRPRYIIDSVIGLDESHK